MEIQKGCAYLGIIEPHEYDDVKKTHVYKQVLTKAEFEIPESKPEIEDFSSVVMQITRKKCKLICGPLGDKIVVTGTINLNVMYTAANPQQSVHNVHLCHDVDAFINIKCLEEAHKSFCGCCDVKMYIEWADLEVVDKRRIKGCFLVLITAKCKSVK
ncbi:SPOCS domain-containing protein [Caldicellulosiruptor sp. F32]|uniref:SPOCS domain-containing protein n=1 Tax=Caldicellulosiruptor sp. F32 TaxID=1214564 RepID=UPI0003A88E83|nr:SPOCS domain-containing protein [Caldicellulosiruptor sp. F32]